jgi:hypothetical protein
LKLRRNGFILGEILLGVVNSYLERRNVRVVNPDLEIVGKDDGCREPVIGMRSSEVIMTFLAIFS